MLERNLQHGICLLHFDEIIFGHLFVFYCGPSTGPGVFKTELGQQVTCISQNLKPITNYKQVKSIFDWSSLLHDTKLQQNHDIQYFFNMAYSISQPNGREFLLKKYGENPPGPGTQDGSRFLNDSAGVLRLYIQTKNPSKELYRLVYISLNFYGPLHFEIKRNPCITNGAKHFFRAMQLFSGLTQDEQAAASKYFISNSFMASFESIGLCAMFDRDPKIRQWAYGKINAARALHNPNEIRKFIKPKSLKWTAKNYIELYDPLVDNYSPPLLADFTNKQLRDHAFGIKPLPYPESCPTVTDKNGFTFRLPNIPCHATNTGTIIHSISLTCFYIIF